MKQDTSIQFLYVDLFCGAGGTSTGVETAKTKHGNCAKVIACVNHDANAIASHAANHPDALHFTEDIRILVLDKLITHVESTKLSYPNAKLILWASLECTNFSKAKGGMARDADSRTLAEHLFRYIDALKPDYIQIENVEEFMSWGELDEKGKPISKTKGTHYHQWVNNVKAYGYDYDFRILNSADFGAYTSRKRFFGIFAKDGLPIIFPKPTHSRVGSSNMVNTLLNWKPVADCLDFCDQGESIFDRKKPLVEATLLRIHAGLIKFVAGGKDKWMLKYNSVNGNTGKHNPPSVDEPCPTVATQNRLGLVQTTPMSEYLIQYNQRNDRIKAVNEPCNTVTTCNRFGLVQTSFLSKYFSGDPYTKNLSITGPAGAITTIDHHSIVNTQFIQTYYSPGGVYTVKRPSCTLTTKDRLALVTPIYFMDMQYGNGSPIHINKPAATVTTNPKHRLIQCDKWLMNTNFANVGSSLNDPAPVITANRKWHYLMNPQFKSKGGSIDKPCFTLIARMDKMPPYLIEASKDTRTMPSFIKIINNTIIYEIYETDTPATKEIKEFMSAYQILDIKMRMLRIPELKMIMGFPKDYILIGTKADQKKFIGNAVEVTIARAMCVALANYFIYSNKHRA